MHTLSGEVKGCFSMLSGAVYSGNQKSAQVIRDYEATTNKRYTEPQVYIPTVHAWDVLPISTSQSTFASCATLSHDGGCRFSPKGERGAKVHLSNTNFHLFSRLNSSLRWRAP